MCRYNTEVTNEDYANGVKDEYGCIYSQDGKRLLSMDKEHTYDTIEVKDGVEIVCDFAFYNLTSLQEVILPNSVVAIGKFAFLSCGSLKSIYLSDSLKEIVCGLYFVGNA